MEFDTCGTLVTDSLGVASSNRSIGPGRISRTTSGSPNDLTMEYSDLIPIVQWRGGSHSTSFKNATAVSGGHACAGTSHLARAESGLTNGGRI